VFANNTNRANAAWLPDRVLNRIVGGDSLFRPLGFLLCNPVPMGQA